MELKINLEIGTTKELAEILKGLLNLVPARKTETSEQEETVQEEVPVVTGFKPEDVKAEEKAPKAEEVKTSPKGPTAEDVRAAMDDVRYRFEGLDFKTNTESEGYKKYHKVLNKWFKYLAGTCGAPEDKPSLLPAESRGAFIKDCAATILNDDGNFTVPYLSKTSAEL